MRGHLLRPPRPYYIASLICGGPELYTKNSRIMYGEGPIGGCDQGHSSETLSIMWALPAYCARTRKSTTRTWRRSAGS